MNIYVKNQPIRKLYVCDAIILACEIPNPVSALMEYAQSRHGTARIDVMCQKGPSHRPRYL
jgi:prephenate dehydrogenase